MARHPDSYLPAVLDLQARYALALDAADAERLGECFADDAVLSVDGRNVVEGGQAIADRLTSRVPADTMHATLGTAIVAAEHGEVHASAYFQVLDLTTGTLRSAGRYDDVVRVAGATVVFTSRAVTYLWRAP